MEDKLEDLENRLTQLEMVVLNEDGTNIAQALIALFQLVHQTRYTVPGLLATNNSPYRCGIPQWELQQQSMLIKNGVGKTPM